MANLKQLKILAQGVSVWNKWREENIDVKVDLHDANLRETNLKVVNLRGADLYGADLHGSDLSVAILSGANLIRTQLHYANLTFANLGYANLSGADLSWSKWSKAIVGYTVFGSIDLREVIGLDEVNHRAPSTIGIDTFVQSKGMIPEEFLRGCGLSNTDIEYAKLSNPDLSNEEINQILYKIYALRATQALQVSPLFISYSHGDGKFVERLESGLIDKGVRFWRDIHDMKAGRLEQQIDKAIRQNPTVLLILSKHSIASDWVEHEVRTARELEKELGRDTLCPVALDDSWKSSRWPKRVMEQVMEYNILDFSEWKDDVKFEGMFRRLIDGLELFYKG